MTIPQLKMLKLFTERRFTIPQALTLDQRVFGGLCHHAWLDYSTIDNSFGITETGEMAFIRASRTHNFRKFNNGRFSVRVPRIRKGMHVVISARARRASA